MTNKEIAQAVAEGLEKMLDFGAKFPLVLEERPGEEDMIYVMTLKDSPAVKEFTRSLEEM